MKSISLFFFALFISVNALSQDMTNKRLGELIATASDSIIGQEGRWQFYFKQVTLICLTDSTYNRMRIISPIADAAQLDGDLKNAALIANFHTALDVKYAIADDVLWSAFIHPLRELSDDQVTDAISQVYAANVTFGTTFSSTDLLFPGAQNRPEKEKNESIKKEKF